MRQSLDQIATRQQQVADAVDKLQATEQNILNKVSAALDPWPAVVLSGFSGH